MRWTNKHNIDPAIASAVMLMEERGDIGAASVTQVIQPPQIVALARAHWDDIEEDVSDGLWRLMGRAMHHVVAEANTDNQLVEERLFVDADGWKISGQPDLWREPADLIDFKLTSVWAFLLGRKQDWEDQLNFYAVLYRAHGFSVQRLKISALLRDWQRNRYKDGGDYPPAPFVERPVKVWDPLLAEERLAMRVREYMEARAGRYRPCTDEERWAKPDEWAVRKRGVTRALPHGAHLADLRSAEAFAESQRHKFAVEIDHRPGGNPRCEAYCRVARWCEQAKALGVVKAEGEAEEGVA